VTLGSDKRNKPSACWPHRLHRQRRPCHLSLSKRAFSAACSDNATDRLVACCKLCRRPQQLPRWPGFHVSLTLLSPKQSASRSFLTNCCRYFETLWVPSGAKDVSATSFRLLVAALGQLHDERAGRVPAAHARRVRGVRAVVYHRAHARRYGHRETARGERLARSPSSLAVGFDQARKMAGQPVSDVTEFAQVSKATHYPSSRDRGSPSSSSSSL